jgi:hypothetical protein
MPNIPPALRGLLALLALSEAEGSAGAPFFSVIPTGAARFFPRALVLRVGPFFPSSRPEWPTFSFVRAARTSAMEWRDNGKISASNKTLGASNEFPLL